MTIWFKNRKKNDENDNENIIDKEKRFFILNKVLFKCIFIKIYKKAKNNKLATKGLGNLKL